MKGRKNKKRRGICYWFPRISILVFVIFAFLFIASDLVKIVYLYPLALEFILSTFSLFILSLFWRNNVVAGTIFILMGLLFYILSIHKILLVGVLFVSIWLFLSGLLFYVDLINNPPVKKRKTFGTAKKAMVHTLPNIW